MPELPDVEVYRRRLASATRRRRIEAASVRDPDLLVGVGAHRLDRALGGVSVGGTRRHGKNLYLTTRGGPHLRLHFGMTGDLVVVPARTPTEDEPRHTRVALSLSGGRRVLFVDQRKLGEVELVEDVDDDIERRGLGPDALALSMTELAGVLRESRGALKPTLMDQGRIAGLGNIYSDEILFQARLDPRAPAASVGTSGVRRLHRQLRRVLERAIDGEVRSFPRGWLIHRREDGAECPRGNGQVRRFSSAGRHGYLCPVCQSHPDPG